MNERIRELADKATIRGEEYLPGNDGHPTPTTYFDKEKFAELIVQECMELAKVEKSRYANLYNKETDQNQYLNMLYCATSMDNYRFLLKEHFGVK